MFLHVLALPAVVVEQQIRILWQQRQGFAQLLQTFGKPLQIAFLITGQGDLQIGMATIVNQLQDDIGLLHLPGRTGFAGRLILFYYISTAMGVCKPAAV